MTLPFQIALAMGYSGQILFSLDWTQTGAKRRTDITLAEIRPCGESAHWPEEF
jgi:hypothetical protein